MEHSLTLSTPFTSDKYNQFFHPNICHVCKSRQNIKPCEKCHMITYCSSSHKSLDRPKHEEICKAIIKARKEQPTQANCCLNSQQWYNLRNSVVHFVEKKLERSLDKFESEIICNAKSCFICHKQHALHALQTCNICFSAYFCKNHMEEFYEKHNPFCKGLLLHLNISIMIIDEPPISLIYEMSKIPFDDVSSSDMRTFIHEYIKNEENYYLTPKDYIFSDYVSEPLTLYNGMKEAGLLSLLSLREETACTVHIIVEGSYNKNNTDGWELLLHLLSNKNKLTIVIIGQHLQRRINMYKQCCNICRNSDRELICEFHPTSYCSYVNSQEYKEPDIIMELSKLTILQMTIDDIKALQLQFCPIIITSSSLSKLKNKIIQMENAIGTTIRTLLLKKNKFDTLIPRKILSFDTIYYRNMYMAIF